MDYTELAVELAGKMQLFHRLTSQKRILEILHGEAFLLHCIANHGEVMLPGEISHEMAVSSARVAAALNKLESKGLITRQIDINDRRRILVCLTQEGRERADKHRRILIEKTAKMLASLGEHDAKEYVRIMGRLSEISIQD